MCGHRGFVEVCCAVMLSLPGRGSGTAQCVVERVWRVLSSVRQGPEGSRVCCLWLTEFEEKRNGPNSRVVTVARATGPRGARTIKERHVLLALQEAVKGADGRGRLEAAFNRWLRPMSTI